MTRSRFSFDFTCPTEGLRPLIGFPPEVKEVIRAVRTNTPSKLLAGDLACDAVVLCQKQTQSVQRGRPVKV